MNRWERRRRLAQLAEPKQRDARSGPVHRRAVLMGAPTRLPAPRDVHKGRRLRAAALVREAAFTGARMAGAKVVELKHPGAAGHERCRTVCVTYS
jgi:hypothetical protein